MTDKSQDKSQRTAIEKRIGRRIIPIPPITERDWYPRCKPGESKISKEPKKRPKS